MKSLIATTHNLYITPNSDNPVRNKLHEILSDLRESGKVLGEIENSVERIKKTKVDFYEACQEFQKTIGLIKQD